MPGLILSKEAHVTHAAAGLSVDESTHPTLVDFGQKNLRDENVRQDKRGALDKRNGFAVPLTANRTDGTSAGAGYKLFTDRLGVPCRISDALTVETYSTRAAAWVSTTRAPEVSVKTTGLPAVMGATELGVQDIEYVNGYLVAVTEATSSTSNDALLAILDSTTLEPVTPPQTGFPRTYISSYADRYVIFFHDDATTLQVRLWDTATSSASFPWSGGAIFTASAGDWSTALSDYAVCGLSDRVALAYVNNTAGASRITVRTFDYGTGLLQTTTINTSSVKPDAVDIRAFPGGTLYVAWNEGAAVKMIGLTASNLAAVIATTATILTAVSAINLVSISPDSATTGRIFVNAQLAVFSHTCGYRTTAGAVAPIGSAATIANVAHCSRPFFYNGRHYVMAFGGCLGSLMSTNTQKVAILCDWTDPGARYLRPIANVAPSLAVLAFRGKTKIIQSVVTTSQWFTGIGVTRSGVAAASTLVTFDFADTKRWQPASIADSVFLSGGMLSYFDGTRVAEVGFLVRPRVSTFLSGVGLTGTFRYVAVYEEVDADGNWCVSGVSDPSNLISPANQTVNVAVTSLTITARSTSTFSNPKTPNVRVAIYRTLTGAVAPYYRVATVANDVTVQTMTFADANSDAALASNAPLYRQPGVNGSAQDKRPPPNMQCVVAYNGMLVGASGSDVWYSGQLVSGEGVWFNPIFQVPIPGEGDITALAVLDGALVIFKRRDVYLITGEPPADNGSSGGLGAPRRIACDVGCIDSRSTCLTAMGVFFMSERGIEILTRAQTVEWIGQEVAATVAANPICTSVTVEPVQNVVFFELAASEGAGSVSGTGCAVVYDLALKSWVSKDRRTTGIGSDQPSQSACIVQVGGVYRYAWMDIYGRVYVETPGTSLGAGVYWITSLFETGNARHGLQQLQRIWSGMLLYERTGAAGLKVEIAYDYAAYSAANDKVWTEAETLTGRQLQFMPKPLGQSMRFRVSDTAPAVLGTGAGLTFIGMSLDTAPKQGPTTGTPRLDPAFRK